MQVKSLCFQWKNPYFWIIQRKLTIFLDYLGEKNTIWYFMFYFSEHPSFFSQPNEIKVSTWEKKFHVIYITKAIRSYTICWWHFHQVIKSKITMTKGYQSARQKGRLTFILRAYMYMPCKFSQVVNWRQINSIQMNLACHTGCTSWQ